MKKEELKKEICNLLNKNFGQIILSNGGFWLNNIQVYCIDINGIVGNRGSAEYCYTLGELTEVQLSLLLEQVKIYTQ